MTQTLATVLNEICEEIKRAQFRFPPFNSGHEGYAVIKEELDELWVEVMKKQSTEERPERMRKEALQTAAMAIRFILDLPEFKN